MVINATLGSRSRKTCIINRRVRLEGVGIDSLDVFSHTQKIKCLESISDLSPSLKNMDMYIHGMLKR